MKRLALVGALASLPLSAQAGGGSEFSFHNPGDLHPGSGTGAADSTVYVPGMRYPMESGPSFPNSQVWGHGGGSGPGGGQCDTENYSYPWRDNYCETRSWDMPLCPSGTGHQGQDIRPATCDAGEHWNVASEAGTVTNIGSYSVYVTGADGTRFDYLHGSGNAVSNGQAVAKGERINRVDNEFGGTPTTIHLHYNLKQDVAGVGFVFVSPYMSLVESYRELLGIGGGTVGDAAVDGCSAVVGWAHDENAPTEALWVQVYFDGAPGDRGAIGVEVLADEYRESLCEMLGSCEHGFTLELPRSLQDGLEHPIRLFSGGSEDSAEAEIETASSFTCDTPAIPGGVLRRIDGPEVVSAWGLSPFWDAAVVDNSVIAGLPVGEPFPDRPVLVRTEGSDTIWWMDPGSKRRVPDASAAEAWGLDIEDAQLWPAHVLADVAEGPPMRADVFLLQAPDGTLYALDEPACHAEGCEPGADSEGGDDSGDGGADDEGGGEATDGAASGQDTDCLLYTSDAADEARS
ncbi:MAG: M23 family metallopeptidase, partial [Nannocystaceae bacterium]|nr:M23 family metallopeptidase [Nannocystaceae bacterium]